jgi:hypothetical protein
MKNKIFWWLLKRYIKKNRDIIKIDEDDEMKLFLFRTSDDVNQLIRALLTNQTIKHWEAQTDDERLMTRGAAIILKVLRDGHNIAEEVYDKDNHDESIKKYRNKKKRTIFKKFFIY